AEPGRCQSRRRRVWSAAAVARERALGGAVERIVSEPESVGKHARADERLDVRSREDASPGRAGDASASRSAVEGAVMRITMPTVARILVIVASSVAVGASTSGSKLVVHEWGTFLAMNGSDGVTLDGMYHEEHALPAFVHARGRGELRLRTSNLKGETP